MPYHVVVFYPNDDDLKLDTTYYLQTHMPMVQEKFGQYGLQGWEAVEFNRDVGADGEKAPYALQAVLIWDKAEDVAKAMSSPEAQVVFGDLANFCNKKPISMGGSVLGTTRRSSS